MAHSSAMIYSAPVKDMLFVMNELAGLSQIISCPRYSSLGNDASAISKILEKAASDGRRVGSKRIQSSQELPRLVTTAYNEIVDGGEAFISGCSNIALIDRIYQKCLHHTQAAFNSQVGDIHSDESRKLFVMRSFSESLRALGYYSASLHDAMTSSDSSHITGVNRAIFEFISPVSQGFSIGLALEAATIGAQIHKRWNFTPEIELSKISEKDISIWANDLILQKTLRDGGAVGRVLIRKIEKTEDDLQDSGSKNALIILRHLTVGRKALDASIDCLLKGIHPGAVIRGGIGADYLQICGLVLSGWQMARAALAAERLRDQDNSFYEAKIMTAKFFMANILPRAQALLVSLINGVGDELSER